MNNIPINHEIVSEKILASNLGSLGRANIREIVLSWLTGIEEATGVKFIRMEMGVPGLDPSPIGIDAEIEALKRGWLRYIR
jgi:hypothetical protein